MYLNKEGRRAFHQKVKVMP